MRAGGARAHAPEHGDPHGKCVDPAHDRSELFADDGEGPQDVRVRAGPAAPVVPHAPVLDIRDEPASAQQRLGDRGGERVLHGVLGLPEAAVDEHGEPGR
jgi:hypothetical protein